MIALDLRRLRLLRELEERGTLWAVASALGYSPSAVSQQLAVLEKEVGVPLLEKAGRGVRLTDAGRLLSHRAGVLLSAAEAARSDLASLTGDVRGTVRAGGLQSATRRVLIPVVARMLVNHPQVRVEVSELELEQALPDVRLGTRAGVPGAGLGAARPRLKCRVRRSPAAPPRRSPVRVAARGAAETGAAGSP